jgi:ankyrin repeat protein
MFNNYKSARNPTCLGLMHVTMTDAQRSTRYGLNLTGILSIAVLIAKAAYAGQPVACKFLIAQGAAIDPKDARGATPLHIGALRTYLHL